jgi:hypothetical protein
MKNFRLVLFLVLLASVRVSASESLSLKNFSDSFNLILTKLDSVLNAGTSQYPKLKEHYDFVKHKLQSGELTLVYDSTLNNDFYGCSSFNMNEKDHSKINLSFGRFLCDKYTSYPFLCYAIVINSFQNAYDFYNNQELFQISMDNPIEKTFFGMDAIAMECMFLGSYAKGSKQLGPVEKLLIADLQHGLETSSILFYKTDLTLLHRMDDLKSTDKSGKELLHEFDKIGKELIDNIKFDGNEWQNYCSAVTLRTYIYYSRQVIYDIVHAKNGVDLSSFDLNSYKDNQKTITKLQNIIGQHNACLDYQTNVFKKYGDAYRNNSYSLKKGN